VLADIAALCLKLTSSRATDCSRNVNGDGNWSNNGNRNNTRALTVWKYFNKNYCWTHGYHIHRDHTSQTCEKPKAGHQKLATRANTMNSTHPYKDLVM
jgi:hypothetical protein